MNSFLLTEEMEDSDTTQKEKMPLDNLRTGHSGNSYATWKDDLSAPKQGFLRDNSSDTHSVLCSVSEASLASYYIDGLCLISQVLLLILCLTQ